MNYFLRSCGFSLCLLIGSLALGQQPSAIILLQGQVMEQIGQQFKSVSGFPMQVEHYGYLETDNNGQFSIKIPYKSNEIKIEVSNSSYQIMRPPDGSVLLQGNLEPNTALQLKIIVLSNASNEAFRKRMDVLNDNIVVLENRNSFTRKQLHELRQTMTDTILHYEEQRLAMDRAISQLEGQLASSGAANQALEDSLQSYRQMTNQLAGEVTELQQKLLVALEERYNKQKAYFDEIDYNFATYLSRLKDFRDWLKRVRYCFRNVEAAGRFASTISAYSEIYEKLNGEKENHIHAVGHYWPDTTLTDQTAMLYDHVLEQIHKGQMLPLNDTVIKALSDYAAGGKPRAKKAVKAAGQVLEKLNPQIEQLEQDIARYHTALSDF